MKAWLGRFSFRCRDWLHAHLLAPPPAMLERVRRRKRGSWRCIYFMDEVGQWTFQVYYQGSWFADGSASSRTLAYRVARLNARRSMYERGLRCRMPGGRDATA